MSPQNHKTISASGDFPYFRRLWNSIVVCLLGAAFIPLIVVGGGMYYYAASALKEKTLSALRSDVQHHQWAVDRFLQERIRDLEQVADILDPEKIARPEVVAAILESLNAHEPLLTDLGIVDPKGRHLAYAGPFALLDRNYENTEWFRALTDKHVFVSDLFTGFRQIPHFIIAVKKNAGSEAWIVRATINAAYFDQLVGRITTTSGGHAFLVNADGMFQTTPPGPGRLMGPSGMGRPERFAGIRVAEREGRIRVLGWLKSAPWLSVVQMESRDIFAMLRKVRNVALFVFGMGAMLIGLTVLLTTNYLMGRLEFKRRAIRLMDHHLTQANRMTLSLQLYTGFFQEVNETLNNIGVAAAWIGELVHKIDRADAVRQEIGENLEQIRAEILRSRRTIHQLIGFSHVPDPLITELNINALISETAALFQRELHYSRIRLDLRFPDDPLWVRSDASRLKQVFENLLFNALTAVGKDGTIGIDTGKVGDRLRITVWDDGAGIPAEIAERIFEPLFTTHPKRLGLGLSISRGIMEKLGGSLTADRSRAKGAAFVVEMPLRFASTAPGSQNGGGRPESR